MYVLVSEKEVTDISELSNPVLSVIKLLSMLIPI